METIVRDLRKRIISKKIKASSCGYPRIIRDAGLADLQRKIHSCVVTSVKRRGKNILIGLSGKKTLWVHLRMTGNLLFKNGHLAPNERVMSLVERKHVHFELCFDDNSRLLFADPRKFGRVAVVDEEPDKVAKNPERFLLAKLGLEPLSRMFSLRRFAMQIQKRNKAIKEVLMDQSIIAGIGNIYASEILFAASINPFKKARDLTSEEISRLHCSQRAILKKAIRYRGTSISDYRDASGEKGAFATQLQVYKRAGEKCSRCGNIIHKSRQAQRSTFYCKYCQKA